MLPNRLRRKQYRMAFDKTRRLHLAHTHQHQHMRLETMHSTSLLLTKCLLARAVICVACTSLIRSKLLGFVNWYLFKRNARRANERTVNIFVQRRNLKFVKFYWVSDTASNEKHRLSWHRVRSFFVVDTLIHSLALLTCSRGAEHHF